MQQAISDNNTEINNDVNGLAQEMENVSVNNGSAAEDAPVPTYDQQFPTLGGAILGKREGGPGVAKQDHLF